MTLTGYLTYFLRLSSPTEFTPPSAELFLRFVEVGVFRRIW